MHRTTRFRRGDVVLMAVSSRVREPFEFGEAFISDWKHAGLIKQSIFKPLIATVEQSKILRKLGELTTADLENLKAVIDIILYT